ncbi:MAG TPA: hypothetical protein VJ278_03260 [Chthoniobacterales bacterium]|nr:hypothetical protein [Chthoniobacterales bacterium]
MTKRYNRRDDATASGRIALYARRSSALDGSVKRIFLPFLVHFVEGRPPCRP